MKFKEFIEREGFNEIWDYIADPSNMPVLMGAAGAGGAALAKAGKWAMDKLTAPGRDTKAMQHAYEDLMNLAQQHGADSQQAKEALQYIQTNWPALVSMATRQLDQIRQQESPDDGNILPMVRSPQSANRSVSRPQVGGRVSRI